MPVKKKVSTKKSIAKKTVAKASTTKAISIKKPIVKKAITKTSTKKVVKPSVTVETKKTNPVHTCCCSTNCEKFTKIIVCILVILNLLFALFFFFRKDPALKLEELKVGWADNMKKVEQLYNSNLYKDQQTSAIDQYLAWQQ